jgi:hypothetical protein
MHSTATLDLVTAGSLPATSKVYTALVRLRKWNVSTSPLRCPCLSTSARLLRKRLPSWGKGQHLVQAAYHRARAEKLDTVWLEVWHRAITEAFGRAPLVGDYKISAVGRDEVAERHKRVLRHCAYQATVHAWLAFAHERVAASRSLPR